MSKETRERILQAALAVLGRRGYENTTIKDIAEEAAVAQGLIHYYYKSKQQLVVSALLLCCEKIALDVASVADVPAAFELLKAGLRDNADFHRVFIEMIGVGLHDSQVGHGVLQFIRSDRGLIEQAARSVVGAGEQADRNVRGLAAAVWGASLGIMVQNLIDPDFDADAAVDGLAQMVMTTVSQLTAPA